MEQRFATVAPPLEEVAGEGLEEHSTPLVPTSGRVSGARLVLNQLEALLRKNATLTWRNKPAAFVQFIATFIFILLIYGVSEAIQQADSKTATYKTIITPSSYAVPSIPDCGFSYYESSPCYDFMWAPNTDPVARNIVQNIMANNVPPIDASKVLEFTNISEANKWASANYQRVLGAYEFFIDYTSIPKTIEFGIQVNGTTKNIRGVVQDDFNKVLMPMQVAVEREIARYLLASNASNTTGGFGSNVSAAQAVHAIPSWSIELNEYPRPAAQLLSLVGSVAPTFLLAAAMFVFSIQIFNVVQERELKLRSSMRVMGVSDAVWWLSWVLWDICFTNVLEALLICAFGNAFPFDLFRRNQFSVVFIHFWLFLCSLTGLGYFMSTFIAKANGATFAGFTIFLFGFIFQLIVQFGVPFNQAYGGDEFGSNSGNGQYLGLQIAFSLFSPCVFAKGIYDLGLSTASSTLPGIKWHTRDSYCYCNKGLPPSPYARLGSVTGLKDFTYLYQDKTVHSSTFVCSNEDYRVNGLIFPSGDCDYSINECWQWMVLDFFLFMGLTLLFDQVNKNEFGVSSFSATKLFSWSSIVWFLTVAGLVVGLGLAGSPLGSSNPGSVIGGIILALIAISVFFYWYKLFTKFGGSPSLPWLIAHFICSIALFLPVILLAAIFFILYFCSPVFAERHKSIVLHMIPLAPLVFGVIWLVQDISGLVRACFTGRSDRAERLTMAGVEAAAAAAGSMLPHGLDDDVAAEEHAIKARLHATGAGIVGPLEPNVSVEVRGLIKSFDSFHAVRGNFFRVERGKLFALLGPNGAGKTTTINLLTGVLPITGGDANVCGHSIVAGELPAIRRLMGVCPQFDILWGEMTAREHLRLFAALKGLPREQWDSTTVELLERTKLTAAADRRVSGFSGGMKRRLSVAIALIGDPEVVYLDEPTTGMDPITRRYVWDIILEAKVGRAIVLTTHSMEEADVLADNITIIAKGRLRCFGSALRLKNKFGAGYRIAASTAAASAHGAASVRPGAAMSRSDSSTQLASRNAPLLDFFKAQLGLEPTEVGRVYTTFAVPRSMEAQLAPFLLALDERKAQLGVTDVQISQTSLEQVFLYIAREAEKLAATAEGKTVTLEVTTAGGVQKVIVPWGAEQVVVAQSGDDSATEAINIFWIQDDEGRLMYSHHEWRGESISQPHVNDKPAQGCCC